MVTEALLRARRYGLWAADELKKFNNIPANIYADCLVACAKLAARQYSHLSGGGRTMDTNQADMALYRPIREHLSRGEVLALVEYHQDITTEWLNPDLWGVVFQPNVVYEHARDAAHWANILIREDGKVNDGTHN